MEFVISSSLSASVDFFPNIFVAIDISTYLVLQLKQIQDNVVLLLIAEFLLHLDGRILLLEVESAYPNTL